jgi:hypothetical protein
VRHAEACRRAGERIQAIASYRAAADLLLELGCESRARGALKAALELDPKDSILQAEVARLEPHAPAHDEAYFGGSSERTDEPLLPVLDSGVDPVPPPPPSVARLDPRARAANVRKPALPPIHRALPSVPSVAPLVPPVLLPAPSVPALPPCSATEGGQAQAVRPVTPPPLPPRAATANRPAPPTLVPTPAPAQALQSALVPPPLVPPPPPAEAFIEDPAELPSVVVSPELLIPEPTPAAKPQVEIRRLSPNVLAFRCSPTDSWALIRSKTPLEMHLVEDLAKLPPVPRDFTLDITVEPVTERAPSPVN